MSNTTTVLYHIACTALMCYDIIPRGVFGLPFLVGSILLCFSGALDESVPIVLVFCATVSILLGMRSLRELWVLPARMSKENAVLQRRVWLERTSVTYCIQRARLKRLYDELQGDGQSLPAILREIEQDQPDGVGDAFERKLQELEAKHDRFRELMGYPVGGAPESEEGED